MQRQQQSGRCSTHKEEELHKCKETQWYNIATPKKKSRTKSPTTDHEPICDSGDVGPLRDQLTHQEHSYSIDNRLYVRRPDGNDQELEEYDIKVRPSEREASRRNDHGADHGILDDTDRSRDAHKAEMTHDSNETQGRLWTAKKMWSRSHKSPTPAPSLRQPRRARPGRRRDRARYEEAWRQDNPMCAHPWHTIISNGHCPRTLWR